MAGGVLLRSLIAAACEAYPHPPGGCAKRAMHTMMIGNLGVVKGSGWRPLRVSTSRLSLRLSLLVLSERQCLWLRSSCPLPRVPVHPYCADRCGRTWRVPCRRCRRALLTVSFRCPSRVLTHDLQRYYGQTNACQGTSYSLRSLGSLRSRPALWVPAVLPRAHLCTTVSPFAMSMTGVESVDRALGTSQVRCVVHDSCRVRLTSQSLPANARSGQRQQGCKHLIDRALSLYQSNDDSSLCRLPLSWASLTHLRCARLQELPRGAQHAPSRCAKAERA